MGYLRFTPAEYEAIDRACLPVHLSEDFFLVFKFFLVEALAATLPNLADRVAQFRPHRLRILFDHLRGERPAPPRHGLTPAEFAAFAAGCAQVVVPYRFVHHVRDFMVDHFRKTSPRLGRKLARLSLGQFDRLYSQVQEQRRKNR